MKKRLIRNILCSAGLLLLAAGGVRAHETAYKRGFVVVADSLAIEDGSLRVRMEILMDRVKVPSRVSFILTPVVTAGGMAVDLPEIIVNGRNRDKVYRRNYRFSHDRYEGTAGEPYLVMKNRPRERMVVRYEASVPFDPERGRATLKLKEELYGCAGNKELVLVEPLSSIQVVKEEVVVPIVVERKPVLYQKEGAAFLDYPVNQTVIRYDYRDNAREIDQVNRTLSAVLSDENAVIRSIVITGYASPEGPYDLNMRLSEGRAESFADYLIARYGLDRQLFDVRWEGEDWRGLRELVEASSMPQKFRVLDLIERVPVMKGLEKQLMDLDGGRPYRYMLKEYFPRLRRVQYRIVYTLFEE